MIKSKKPGDTAISEMTAINSNPVFNAYWNQSPDNLFLLRCEPDDFILEAINPSQAEAMGIQLHSQFGTSLKAILPQEFYDRLVANYRHCMAVGHQICYEEPYINPEGEYTYWETLLTPILDAEGLVIRIAGRSRNITQLRGLQKRLEEQQQLSSKAQSVKMAFLANMSHEMRTPLNGITGAVSLLLNCEDKDEQLALSQVVQTSVEQLGRLTNDILDYAKLNSGSLSLEQDNFSPAQIQSDVVNMLKPMAQTNNTTLNSHSCPSSAKFFYGDSGRIRQILLNLTNNAVKFSPDGQVDVMIEIQNNRTGRPYLLMQVKDTGIGICETDIKRLFKPFTQLDSSATRTYQGAGLGLAICKELTKLMGGSIHVNSSQGQGSTFSVHLPLRNATTIKPQNLIKDQLFNTRFEGRVLLVEDNQINSMVAKKMLEHLGLKVTLAYNGQEAIDKLEQGGFNIVLMDWHMPVIDGLEATRQIRQFDGDTKDIPIIGITANVLLEQKTMCMNAGMNAVITKPIQFDNLVNILSDHLTTKTAPGN